MEIQELLKIAAEPHLVTTARQANDLLAELNAVIADLRVEVRDLELASALHLNQLLKRKENSIALNESDWKVSEIYIEWQKRKGELADIRSIRKNLQRLADLLWEQERWGSKTNKFPSGGF